MKQRTSFQIILVANLQRGVTPAGPPSYTAARITPGLNSPTNTQVDFKMAGYILAGSRPRPRHFRRRDTLFSGTGQGTRDDPATLFQSTLLISMEGTGNRRPWS